MNNEELLKIASEFNLGPEPIVNGRAFWWEKYPKELRRYSVYVKNMGNPDGEGPDTWAIIKNGFNSCLNKLGEWEHYGMPSGRLGDFYERCRYESAQEAIEFYEYWKATLETWAKEKLSKDGNAILNYDDWFEERKMGT
jgi:hypothetical protein